MPLFTKTILSVTALLGVPVFGIAVIAAAYPSPILTHLVDVINGNRSTTVVATNAPNWELGLLMTPPIISSAATSSTGTLASSTAFTFEVAALDGTGTTTLTNPATVTTDQSPEGVLLKWGSVNGATAYAVYFSTSTTVGTGLTQYFYATTSGQYLFSTSTGSLGGSYTRENITAFSELLNPNGTEIFNDSITSATSSLAASTTAMQVNGTAAIVTNGTTTACETDTAGVIFYNLANSHEWGCNGSVWTKIF